jgi:hypothetical protein
VAKRIELPSVEEVAAMDRDPKKLKATQWPFKVVVDKKPLIVMAESEKGSLVHSATSPRRWHRRRTRASTGACVSRSCVTHNGSLLLLSQRL